MSFRRDFITKPIFSWAHGVLPTMSDTEREALEAGDVWWDADLFTGNPDWSKLLATAPATLTDEMIGVIGLEGKPEQRRNRSQRDVALVPVQPQAEHFATFELALADDAGVDHRRGIRAGLGAGQPEAGNIATVGKPRQPALLLLFGAEPHQEFAGSQ